MIFKIFFVNLELSAICLKIFDMHVPIYHCGMKNQFICTKQLYYITIWL